MPAVAPGPVDDGPRDRMEAVVEHGRVDHPVADRAARIRIAREERRDVGPREVVGDGAERNAVDVHPNRRPVGGDRLRLRRQRPTEVHVVGAGDRLTLVRGIDGAERRDRRRVVHDDGALSEKRLGEVGVDRVRRDLERAVALLRQHVGEQHEAPPRATLPGSDGYVARRRAARLRRIPPYRGRRAGRAVRATPSYGRCARLDAEIVERPSADGYRAVNDRAVERDVDEAERRCRLGRRLVDPNHARSDDDRAARSRSRVGRRREARRPA